MFLRVKDKKTIAKFKGLKVTVKNKARQVLMIRNACIKVLNTSIKQRIKSMAEELQMPRMLDSKAARLTLTMQAKKTIAANLKSQQRRKS
jgi:ABC-type Na+ transport system ATPase subunit NatA